MQRSHPELPLTQHEPVFYFMHGIWEDHKAWMKTGYADALTKLSQTEKFPPATFVSFETASISLFTDHTNDPRASDSYESWFLNEFIPWIEKIHGVCASRECRGLMGVSMGGLGAIKTALRHPHLFFLAAANSAALVPFNVFEPMSRWKSYFDRHPIGNLKGSFLINRARSTFRTAENFDLHDPLKIVTAFASELWPALYFDVGGKDSYGFQEGAFLFKKALEDRKLPFTFYFEPKGGHDLVLKRNIEVLRYIRERLSAQTYSVMGAEVGAGAGVAVGVGVTVGPAE